MISHIFSVLSFLEILEAFFCYFNVWTVQVQAFVRGEKHKGHRSDWFFLSHLLCPKGAFRRHCSAWMCHHWPSRMTGKPLTSASWSTDCCRFRQPVRDMTGLLQRQTDPRSAHRDLPSGRRLNVSRAKGVYLDLFALNRLSGTRF